MVDFVSREAALDFFQKSKYDLSLPEESALYMATDQDVEAEEVEETYIVRGEGGRAEGSRLDA